jgi:hypothetical protein
MELYFVKRFKNIKAYISKSEITFFDSRNTPQVLPHSQGSLSTSQKKVWGRACSLPFKPLPLLTTSD